PGRRLVEEQHAWLVDRRARELEQAHLPDRQAPCRLGREVGETALLDRGARHGAAFRRAPAPRRRRDQVGEQATAAAVVVERDKRVVLHREPPERLLSLERAAYAVSAAPDCRARRDVDAVEEDA